MGLILALMSALWCSPAKQEKIKEKKDLNQRASGFHKGSMLLKLAQS